MASCTKDPDNGGNGGNNGGGNNGSYQDKIVGEWQMIKKMYYKYDTIGVLVNESILEEGDEYWDEELGYYKFMSNGMVVVNSEIFHKSNTENVIVPYLIEGDTLYISDGYSFDDDFTYTIKELTNSTMVWEQERIRNDYLEGYVVVPYKHITKLVFKKVN